MIDLALLKKFVNHDIRLQIALFIEPEAWGDFAQSEDFARFKLFLRQIVLSLFPEILCFPGKTKEESLFLLLTNIGIQLPSSSTPARYPIVWDYIQRIRANPASVPATKKVMFALMFPRWLRSSLTEKARQAAYITAVLLQNIKNFPLVQERSLAAQLTQWLFSGQGIHPVFNTLWRQGQVRLVLSEMLDKMEGGEGELSLVTEADLNRALQRCFTELKDFCQKHVLRENSSLEELSKKTTEYTSLSRYARVLELLVLAGVDLRHIRVPDGQNILHFSASHGYVAMIERLLAAGADVNLVDAQGRTALHRAASCGSAMVVEQLIAAGADVNLVDGKRKAALHRAASQGHAAVVERLLAAAGADVNLVDAQGRTALHRAASCGSAMVVEQLIAAGADVNLVDGQGKTALNRAVYRGDAVIVKRLLAAGVDVNLVDAHGQTALHRAASCGSSMVVEQLIVAGADVNLVDVHGQTALHHAVYWRGDAVIVKRLLAAGVDVNLVDAKGQTVLHRAASYGCAMVVEQLMAVEADVNLVDAHGQTALHRAASCGSAMVVEQLMAAGADVNLVDAHGQTALHRAVYRGDAVMVKRLLAAAGVDVNIMDLQGKTALHLARLLAADVDGILVDYRHERVMELLLAAGCLEDHLVNPPGSPSHRAACRGMRR